MLYLIRGLPGSGKSTYAKKHFPGIPHFEADMYFIKNGKYEFNPAKLNAAHRWCKWSVREVLATGRDCVVSNTFIQEWEIDPYLDMADDYGIPVKIIELQTQFGSIHDVPKEKMNLMIARWDSLRDLPRVELGIATFNYLYEEVPADG